MASRRVSEEGNLQRSLIARDVCCTKAAAALLADPRNARQKPGSPHLRALLTSDDRFARPPTPDLATDTPTRDRADRRRAHDRIRPRATPTDLGLAPNASPITKAEPSRRAGSDLSGLLLLVSRRPERHSAAGFRGGDGAAVSIGNERVAARVREQWREPSRRRLLFSCLQVPLAELAVGESGRTWIDGCRRAPYPCERTAEAATGYRAVKTRRSRSVAHAACGASRGCTSSVFGGAAAAEDHCGSVDTDPRTRPSTESGGPIGRQSPTLRCRRQVTRLAERPGDSLESLTSTVL